MGVALYKLENYYNKHPNKQINYYAVCVCDFFANEKIEKEKRLIDIYLRKGVFYRNRLYMLNVWFDDSGGDLVNVDDLTNDNAKQLLKKINDDMVRNMQINKYGFLQVKNYREILEKYIKNGSINVYDDGGNLTIHIKDFNNDYLRYSNSGCKI